MSPIRCSIRGSKWALAGLGVAGIAVPALAGNVLTVGGIGGNFDDIQSAVVAAVDDDVILVRAGTYPGFEIVGESLSVVADSGAIVEVDSQVVVRDLPAGKRVVISGLRVVRPGTNTSSFFLAQNLAGSLRLIACELGRPTALGSGLISQHGTSLIACADVALVGCTLQGKNGPSGVYPTGSGGFGLYVLSSKVAVHDSQCTGGSGGGPLPGEVGGGGGSGCIVLGGASFVFSSGSTCQGGSGADGWSASSCQDPAASNGGDGGAGISNGSGAPFPQIVLLDTAAAGGAGGTGGTDACGAPAFDGAPGAAIDLAPGSTVTQLPGSARRATMPVPVREATPLTVTFTGAPGEVVYLTLWDLPGFTYVPGYFGVLLERAPLLRRIRLGVVPGSGVLTKTIAFPELPAGVQARTYFLQAYFVDASNAVRLGTAFGQVVLDSAF